MSTNRARSAALVLSAFIVWPFLSNAASAAMLLSSTANPSSAAAGDRVRFAATVSNTGPAVQAVALTAVVPVSTTVTHSELSFAAYCNGASNYTVCTAGQTLQFVAFNVPAGGSVTVVYPALVSSGPGAGRWHQINFDGHRHHWHQQTPGHRLCDRLGIGSCVIAPDIECPAGAGAGGWNPDLHADLCQPGERRGGGESDFAAPGGHHLHVGLGWRHEQWRHRDLVARHRGGWRRRTAQRSDAGGEHRGSGQSIVLGRVAAQSHHASDAGTRGAVDGRWVHRRCRL